MSVFSRFKDIINANINSILDKAEDPEKMIRLMIREMEDTLVELKSSCASKMADKAKYIREKNELNSLVDKWAGRAVMAVEKGRDDLAREALVEKKRYKERAVRVNEDLTQLEKIVTQSKSDISNLEEKLEQVRQKNRQLIQRQKYAAEQKRANESMYNSSSPDFQTKFDQMESKIERMEADSELAGSYKDRNLEAQFSEIEKQNDIEDELKALKAKKGDNK